MNTINPMSLSAPAETTAITAAASTQARRKAYGEVVGNVFYGRLMKQMNESKIKGEYFHGGRGEEAFRGQLALELGKRMGQSPTDPLVNRMFGAVEKRLAAANDGAVRMNTGDGFPVPELKAYPTAPADTKTYPAREAKEFRA